MRATHAINNIYKLLSFLNLNRKVGRQNATLAVQKVGRQKSILAVPLLKVGRLGPSHGNRFRRPWSRGVLTLHGIAVWLLKLMVRSNYTQLLFVTLALDIIDRVAAILANAFHDDQYPTWMIVSINLFEWKSITCDLIPSHKRRRRSSARRLVDLTHRPERKTVFQRSIYCFSYI